MHLFFIARPALPTWSFGLRRLSVDVALASRGLPRYVEPASPPDVYNDTLFGHSALDADSGKRISEVARIGVKQSGAEHLSLLNYNPY